MTPPPPRSTLFPYTTLFRSRVNEGLMQCTDCHNQHGTGGVLEGDHLVRQVRTSASRSEEHTSELQSRGHLVCRLLLEKKNHNCNHRAPPRRKRPPQTHHSAS